MMNKIVNKLINKMKNKIVPLILSIIAVVSILSQTTYSLLFKEYETEEQNFALGTLEITSNKNVDSVTLTNSLPIEDSEGKETAPYIFTITNVGNLIYQFDVKFLSTTTTNMINSKYIKIMVDDNEPVVLSSLTDGIILEDITLAPEESIEISLRAWLDINTSNTEIGKVFNGKIVTEGIAVYTESAILVTDELLEENTTVTTDDYSWSSSTLGMTKLTLKPGTYNLEVWGAQGGSYNTTYYGGKGGYSYGTLTLTEETDIFVYVGGQGTGGIVTETKTGGYNGGGDAYTGSTVYAAASGAGASDIRIDTNNDGTGTLYERVIVAGGGGGAASFDGENIYSGGAGGGTSGGTGGHYISYSAGTGGSATTPGTSYSGTIAAFGTGASNSSNSIYGIGGGGGGGWYGGGAGRRSPGGGGSGYVYTSSTASNYPSGCLLNSSYYLTDAATIAGNTSFTDFNGSTVTGHSGNGAARISGKESKVTYTIPRLIGLKDISIVVGDSVDLNDGVTLECSTGHTDCSLLGTNITDSSQLGVGVHTIYYIVSDSNNKYKYARTINVLNELTPELVLTKLGLTSNQGNPNFATVATSDEGIYAAEDDLGTSYYFRGAVTNNYVKFGKNSSGSDMYWRIVRINGDGTVRMIYDGTQAHANGTSSTDRTIGSSAYHSAYDDNTYVGYMYGTTGSSSYEVTHVNSNNSLIKNFIDNWYINNLSQYSNYIADAIYCNDRSLASGTGIGTVETYYGSYGRIVTNKSPSLLCTQTNDKFTVKSNSGNKSLSYPIGMLTADEAALAGSVSAGTSGTSNISYYLYTGNNYRTITPYAYNIESNVYYASVFGIDTSGIVRRFYKHTTEQYVKPVISIYPNFINSGTGISTDPFVVG